MRNAEVARQLQIAEIMVKKQKARLIELLRERLRGKLYDSSLSLLFFCCFRRSRGVRTRRRSDSDSPERARRNGGRPFLVHFFSSSEECQNSRLQKSSNRILIFSEKFASLNTEIFCCADPMLPEINEQTLLHRLNRGDQMAFELLFYRYRGKVYNFVKSSLPCQYDAQDLVHEIFLRIWINRTNINPSLPFEPYLFRTVRNLVIDRLRVRVNRLVCLNEEIFATETGAEQTDQSIEERQLGEWFDRTLKQLPEHRRKIFVMSRIDGLSYKEIASQFRITENTVDTQIRRALLFFREEFKKLKLLLFI